MVFNPTSPIKDFASKSLVTSTGSKRSSFVLDENTTMASTSETQRSSSPSSGWRGRLMRQSQDKQPAPKEVSRWSKTTTESELSDAFAEQASKRRSFLKKSISRRKSKDTAKSSPTDPFYDPINKQLRPINDIPHPIITSRQDNANPRSFLDDPSDDDAVDSPTSPVLQRASSVRVSRPRIIQHNNDSAGSVPKLYAQHNRSALANETSAAPADASQDILPSTTFAGNSDHEAASAERLSALKALEGDNASQSEELTALPQMPEATITSNEVKETVLECPDTPSRFEALDTMPTPMGGFGSMRIPRTSGAPSYSTNTSTLVDARDARDGLRSNPPSEQDKKLSRAISAPVRNSARRVMIRPTDLIITKQGHDHKLFRENIVSTPYPARHHSIGDIDGVLGAAAQPQEKSKKTPKLRRSRPLSHHTERSEPEEREITDNTTDLANDRRDAVAPEIPLSTKPTICLAPGPAPATSKSDRFPSPSAPEVLFLDLRLSRHPSARITVEIEVTDKTTFDDEMLFTTIRKNYINDLMGRARWLFCARTLEGASLNNNDIEGTPRRSNSRNAGFWHNTSSTSSPPDFDGAEFIRHVQNPRLGRRRKLWLLWLRNNQNHDSSSPAERRGRRSFLPQPTSTIDEKESHSPVFSFAHSRNPSASTTHIEDGPAANSPDNSVSISAFPAPPTAAPKPPTTPGGSLARMPFQVTNSASPGLSSFNRTKSMYSSHYTPAFPSPAFSHHPYTNNLSGHHRNISFSASASTSRTVTVYLHHTFSIRLLSMITAFLILASLLAMIFWILFGYPGRSAAQGDGSTVVNGVEYAVPWRRDAQARVGVGFLIGVVVFLVGMVLEVGWVWGSWVLV